MSVIRPRRRLYQSVSETSNLDDDDNLISDEQHGTNFQVHVFIIHNARTGLF